MTLYRGPHGRRFGQPATSQTNIKPHLKIYESTTIFPLSCFWIKYKSSACCGLPTCNPSLEPSQAWCCARFRLVRWEPVGLPQDKRLEMRSRKVFSDIDFPADRWALATFATAPPPVELPGGQTWRCVKLSCNSALQVLLKLLQRCASAFRCLP